MDNHPRAFAEFLRDCTPTMCKSGNQLVLAFDLPDQASQAGELLWQAIESLEPDAADPPADTLWPNPLHALAVSHAELTQRVEEIEKTLRTLRQGVNNRL